MASNHNRDCSKRKALRKQRIAEEIFNFSYYSNLHQYSKNKIHCSCPMCSTKTRNKGKKRLKPGNYMPSINRKHSELKRLESMNQDENDII